jgi:hypothetical protein
LTPVTSDLEEEPVPYVTIHTLDGAAAELATRKSTLFDPAVREVAPTFGALASVTVKTETGLIIVNVWESAERVGAFTAHPAIQAARDAAALPMPSSFQRYEAGTFELFQRDR